MKPLLVGLYLLNLGIIFFAWWGGSSALLTGGNTSSTLIALARLSGLLGMYSVLVQYVLMSRNPLVLRYVGLDSYKVHRYNGIASLSFVTLHAILVTAGYSMATGNSILAQELSFIRDFSFVFLAMIAYAIMLVTVGLSFEFIRRHLRPKVWYSVHVFNHSIVWLAIWHQLANGGTLLSNQAFRTYWITLIVLVLIHLIFFRFVYLRLK